MKHSVDTIIGWALGASDGELGKIKELYFEDQSWTVRYLIVETGGWLMGRRVLISPEAVMRLDMKNEIIAVNLTKEQIKDSPDIDTDKPVYRQHENELYQYYGIGNYWMGSLWSGGMGTSGMIRGATLPLEEAVHESSTEGNEAKHNSHLRSTHNVKGYNVKAAGDQIGDVDDFIIDNSTWKIDSLIVTTGDWLSEKKILVPLALVKEIKWDTSSVIINASSEELKNTSEYNSENYQ